MTRSALAWGALVASLALTACHGGPTIVENPTEFIEVPYPVPGETQVIEIPAPVDGTDRALVRLLLGGLGEIGALECVTPHEHSHRADVCGIVTRTLEDAAALNP